jgi:hypothetical protein
MRDFLINADFDISLRPGRGSGTTDGRGRQAGEIPYHLLLLGVDGDSVLVEAELDEEYLAYIERAGIPRPSTTLRPAVNPDAEFRPFGWNEEAVEINRSYASPTPHPPVEVVRRVNGRRYAAALEKDLLGVDEVLGVFDTQADIENCIAARPPCEQWMLKSEHGNAGLGNRRLRSRTLSPSDEQAIHRLLAEDACLLLERWRPRVLDISTVFEVDGTGVAGDVHLYEVVNTADGAYLGSVFEPASETLARWRPILSKIVAKVGRSLAEEGYFGPVCLDHFVWTKNGKQHLRPLADLNARLQMSAPFLRLWHAWGGDRVFYWRLFSARKLRLPPDYGELERALGGDAFDRQSRRGVLVTSPFEIGGSHLRRIGVLLSATSREAVDELDRRLRGRFEK